METYIDEIGEPHRGGFDVAKPSNNTHQITGPGKNVNIRTEKTFASCPHHRTL